MADKEETLSDCRILIVEDHRQTADLLERAMQDWLGVRCTSVETLAEAKEEYEAAAASEDDGYDVIVCDRLLPDGSGLLLPDMIRATMLASTAARTQLIAISAMVGVDDEAESLAAGFDAHLRKPFTLQELVGLVNRLLKRAPCTSAAASA